MANIKISDLTAAAAATGTQEFEVNDSLTSKKVTGAQILSYVHANTGVADVDGLQTALDGKLSTADGAVDTANLADGAVTAEKLGFTIASNALTTTFTTSNTGSVTASTVVNLTGSTVGDNPTANTVTSLASSASNLTWQTYDNLGLLLLRAEFSGGVQYRQATRQVGGLYLWAASPTQVHTSVSGDGEAFIDHLGGAFYFAGMRAGADPNSGNRTATGRCIEINPSTGALVASSNTVSVTSTVINYTGYTRAIVKGVKTDIPNRFVLQETRDNVLYTTNANTSRLATITSSGSISSTQNAGTSEGYDGITRYGWFLLSNNKVLGVRNNASFRIADYNGSSFQNFSTISVDVGYNAGEFAWYRPNPSLDIFVGAYRDSTNQLFLKIYEYIPGSNSVVVRDSIVLAANILGNQIGGISGSGNNITLGWQSNDVGYVSTHTIDTSTKTFTGRGIDSIISSDGRTPFISGPNTATDVYSVFYNNANNGVNSRILTVNAYASVPLIPIGVSKTTVGANSSVDVVTNGVASGFTGLTPGTKYYYNTELYDGSVTTTANDYYVGLAISSTELLLKA